MISASGLWGWGRPAARDPDREPVGDRSVAQHHQRVPGSHSAGRRPLHGLPTNNCGQAQPRRHRGYVGDGDLCGAQIEANTRKVLEQLIGSELNWTRVALTDEQIARYHLEEFRIMKPDRRYKPTRYEPAIECEALQQHIIVTIVREWLESLLPEPLERVHEREVRQRKRLHASLVGKVARKRR